MRALELDYLRLLFLGGRELRFVLAEVVRHRIEELIFFALPLYLAKLSLKVILSTFLGLDHISVNIC